MTAYEFDFWSPILGCDATRISMTDRAGHEYFAIVKRDYDAQFYRDRKVAIEKIEKAIEAGLDPGEVRWR